MLGLLPRAAQVVAGRVAFESAELLHRSDRELREVRWRRIAYVPQGSISAFNPLLRIGTHFRETAAAHGADTDPAPLLRAVRLDAERVLAAYPHELSGGMRQRAAIALALLLGPSLVCSTSRRPRSTSSRSAEVLDIVAELRERTGVSVLLVTHDLSVASYLADRIATMYAGRIVEDAPVDALFEHPRHPYTRGLLRAVPSLDREDARRGGRRQPAEPARPALRLPVPPALPVRDGGMRRRGSAAAARAVGGDRSVACRLHENGSGP